MCGMSEFMEQRFNEAEAFERVCHGKRVGI